MTEASFRPGDRVRIRTKYAVEYLQPFRKLIQSRRPATVVDAHDRAVIRFDTKRKGATPQSLRGVRLDWLEQEGQG